MRHGPKLTKKVDGFLVHRSDVAEVYQPSEAMQAELQRYDAVTAVRIKTQPRKGEKTVILFIQLGGKRGPSITAKLFGVPIDDTPTDDMDEMWRNLLNKAVTLLPKEP